MRVLIITLALATAACSTTWYGGDGTEPTFTKDLYECQRDAAMVPSQGPGSVGSAMQSLKSSRLLEGCMAAKGYRKG